MVSINEFLGMYTPKKTIEGYTTALKHFFNFLGLDPEHYFDEYKKARKGSIQECDEAADKIMMDVTRWLKNMETIGYKHKDGHNRPYSPCTIQSRSGAIRAFLLVNRVDLSRAFWKKMISAIFTRSSVPL